MSVLNLSSSEFEKLVHLDLKGAPPKVSYYEQLFPLLKQLGATGLLIEYEDMFPYQGDLQIISQPDAYSKEEVKRIQQLAQNNGLSVIPLVQTFGHFEFILKHKRFFGMREVKNYPNSLCPSHPESQSLVLHMIRQMLVLHPGAKKLHIGADEVWHLGECDNCKLRMQEKNWTSNSLFLDHVCTIAQRIKEHHPDLTLIMWDDMMRHMKDEIIKESGISQKIVPMVWHYLPPEEFRLKNLLWKKYGSIFPRIWIASAFKGATEMAQVIAPPHFHVCNQKAWIQILQDEASRFQAISGIVLTGWQRYDHFTVLCELLPVAIPSLALCLQTIIDGDLTEEGHQRISDILGFRNKIELDPFPRPMVIPPPSFPGGNVFSSSSCLINLLSEYHVLMYHQSIRGAFTDYQISQNRTNPIHIDQFLPKANALLSNLDKLNGQMQKELSEIYYPSTVEEWLSVNIQPFLDKIGKLVSDAEQQRLLQGCVS